MVSPDNVYTSNIIWTQQVIVRNIYVYTNTYLFTIRERKNKAIVSVLIRVSIAKMKHQKASWGGKGVFSFLFFF